MNKYKTLTRLLLKNGSNPFTIDKKRRVKTIALWLILAVAFAPTIVLLFKFISTAYDALFEVSQQGLILALGISFICIFIFFFGIFYSQNVLYFANDIDILLPLPFKQAHILGAKFTVALFYEYFAEAIFFIPLFVVYGTKSSGNILYYLYGVILFLILPIIPLSIASLIIMIIMSFTNIGKHKDKLKILGGIAAMFLAVGINSWIQKIGMSTSNPDQMIKVLQSGNNSLVSISNKIFPGSSIAAKALILNNSFQGFINMLIFLGITAVIVAIFLALGEKLYFKGVVGISEISSKRKELTSKELIKSVSKNSIIKTLTIKELKILFRTPIYFINCVLMNFLWPVFILIPIFTQPEMMNNIGLVSILVRDPQFMGLVLGISLAVSMFLSSSNGITSTAISREGRHLFISKYVPVSYTTQLTAKLLSGIIMSTIAMIVVLLVGVILVKPQVYLPIIILLFSLPAITFISIIGIIIDLNFPKLNWDNEVKAVKQNFNLVITLFIGMISAILIGFLVIKFENYSFIVSVSLSLILLVIDFILYKFIMIKSVDIIEKIES
jgi:ABC-2 type transport system permease protein